jgi:hypothetical protein
MVVEAQNSHGAKSELNSVSSLEKVDWWNPIRTFAIQSSPPTSLDFSHRRFGIVPKLLTVEK